MFGHGGLVQVGDEVQDDVDAGVAPEVVEGGHQDVGVETGGGIGGDVDVAFLLQVVVDDGVEVDETLVQHHALLVRVAEPMQSALCALEEEGETRDFGHGVVGQEMATGDDHGVEEMVQVALVRLHPTARDSLEESGLLEEDFVFVDEYFRADRFVAEDGQLDYHRQRVQQVTFQGRREGMFAEVHVGQCCFLCYGGCCCNGCSCSWRSCICRWCSWCSWCSCRMCCRK